MKHRVELSGAASRLLRWLRDFNGGGLHVRHDSSCAKRVARAIERGENIDESAECPLIHVMLRCSKRSIGEAIYELEGHHLATFDRTHADGWIRAQLTTEGRLAMPAAIQRQEREPRTPSRRLRFAVFTRDGFACVYCGRRSPQVELVVDHVVPFSKGGETVAANLVTSCFHCNAGKADVLL